MNKNKKIVKPWGYELIIANTDKYVGKILHIIAGEQLSLQYHQVKDETIYLYRGSMELTIEDSSGKMQKKILQEGMSQRIKPFQKHRMKSIQDCDVFEVSTTELDDVVRLEDDYGRA